MLRKARSGFAVLEAATVYRAQTIGEVASEQFFWMHSGFEVALKQPEQAHTGFEVALERQHCQFEPAVAAR